MSLHIIGILIQITKKALVIVSALRNDDKIFLIILICMNKYILINKSNKKNNINFIRNNNESKWQNISGWSWKVTLSLMAYMAVKIE